LAPDYFDILDSEPDACFGGESASYCDLTRVVGEHLEQANRLRGRGEFVWTIQTSLGTQAEDNDRQTSPLDIFREGDLARDELSD
jgi:hypothetical protein